MQSHFISLTINDLRHESYKEAWVNDLQIILFEVVDFQRFTKHEIFEVGKFCRSNRVLRFSGLKFSIFFFRRVYCTSKPRYTGGCNMNDSIEIYAATIEKNMDEPKVS
jgi:hypothetical protein